MELGLVLVLVGNWWYEWELRKLYLVGLGEE